MVLVLSFKVYSCEFIEITKLISCESQDVWSVRIVNYEMLVFMEKNKCLHGIIP